MHFCETITILVSRQLNATYNISYLQMDFDYCLRFAQHNCNKKSPSFESSSGLEIEGVTRYVRTAPIRRT
jgi:hypothetical protein